MSEENAAKKHEREKKALRSRYFIVQPRPSSIPFPLKLENVASFAILLSTGVGDRRPGPIYNLLYNVLFIHWASTLHDSCFYKYTDFWAMIGAEMNA